MARAFSQLTAKPDDETATDDRKNVTDGKTLRGSKDAESKAEHVLSAYCERLKQSVGHTSSRGKGKETPNALELIQPLDLTHTRLSLVMPSSTKEKSSRIIEKGGDYFRSVFES